MRPFSRKEKKDFLRLLLCVCTAFIKMVCHELHRGCKMVQPQIGLNWRFYGKAFCEKTVPSYVALETREVELEVREGYEYGEPGDGRITRETTVQPG